MFVIEAVYGWLAHSNALFADSLDMLGDGIIYGVSLMVLNQEAIWRNRAALAKGYFMAALAFSIMLLSFYRFYNPVMPTVEMMGIIGILAFAANVTCLFLLTRHKNDDINMRSAWICARNDVLANLSVLVAAGGVAWASSPWPDLVISMLICSYILKSSLVIIKEAQEELKPTILPIG
ncbi:MAG: cation transporter [Candidatus Nitronauta litoralis]|uniref:Cation transporter n=1 Tax=Candidatus Nitronauta litoralis TaxID=2705533 RepID=A0A7T0BX33_9BACT|nr:MAG: cation transporter [Candidatus Nitronauta litoralis]